MSRPVWIALAIAAVAVAVILSPLASPLPDGLEWAAEKLGFASRESPLINPPLADYQVPVPAPEPLRTILAGLLGVGITFAAAALAAMALAKRRQSGPAREQEESERE